MLALADPQRSGLGWPLHCMHRWDDDWVWPILRIIRGNANMKPGSKVSMIGRLPCSLVIAAALLTIAACGSRAPVGTTATAPPGVDEASTEDQSPPEAAAILKAMAEYLATLENFTGTTRNSYEVLQSNGRKIEFGEIRRISVARPDRLRVEEIASDGEQDLALFDGKLMTVFNADAGVFAQAPQPAAIDDALAYFVRDLHMRMPLALMLSTRIRTELPEMVTEVDYVESTDMLGVPAHHIAGRTDSVDFQFWIAEGEYPIPLRVVITYREAPGQPQFRADISDWNTSPKFTNTTFQLALPKDARQIPFAVQLQSPGGAQAAANGEMKP
jgi:hypothetical protein